MAEADQDHHESREVGPSSSQLLVAAGRLESQLESKCSASSHARQQELIAWSIDNLLAIVSSAIEIKLVHLALPTQSQRLSIQEKPYLLRFSPEGNVLFAAFATTQTCCVWVRVQALNQWVLRQTWTTWQGRVLDLQWFGEPRRWCPDTKKRKACRGPQFATGNPHKEAGGLVVCDGGQVILFQGRTAGTTLWQVQMCKVPIAIHKKLAKAALGLVPDETSVLLAYTLRVSSKAALPNSSAEGDALGMFFEGANDIAVSQSRQIEIYDPDDGQDRIELAEVRIDLATSSASLYLRRLPPIFFASYDESSMPSGLLTDLLWLEGGTGSGSDVNSAKLRLFANFSGTMSNTLRIWRAHKEDTEALSDAFYKLEAAKVKSSEEEREDWAIRASQVQMLSNQDCSQFQLTPACNKLVCVSRSSAAATNLLEMERMQARYRIIDLNRSNTDDVANLPSSLKTDCKVAFSPSGSLIAQVVDGKVKILEPSRILRWSQDDAVAYLPAVYSRYDLTDIARVSQPSFEDIRRACSLDETSYQQFARMMEIRSQMEAKSNSTHRNSNRLILELLYAYKFLTKAEKNNQFDCTQLWTILAHLEWIIETVEILSKQAYLAHATSSVSSPPAQAADKVMIEQGSLDETDILALMTHKLPRTILTQIIVLLVKFCNWLHRVNRSKEEAKKLLSVINVKGEKDKGVDDVEEPLWSLADNLRLAQMQIDEVLFKSAVDMSQVGRFLKGYKGKEAQDEKPKWWTDFDKGDRITLAKEMVESQCIRDPLSLFCSVRDNEDQEELFSERDILTKVKLNRKWPHSLCLGCTARTQLPLQMDERCLCGSANWWRFD